MWTLQLHGGVCFPSYITTINSQYIRIFFICPHFFSKYFYSRLGETCSHVAAMLFKIEAAVRLEETRVSATDVACQWNKTSSKGCTL